MKTKLKILALIAIISLVIIYGKSSSYADSITVTLTNIKILKGVIRIALYNKKENFPKEGKEYKTAVVPANSYKIRYKFLDIPDGWYAIALYHDINNDGKCNKNLIGIPIEPFGFSNNIKVKFSAPKFNKCSFYVKKDVCLTIILYKK